jgi:hypothetical protein
LRLLQEILGTAWEGTANGRRKLRNDGPPQIFLLARSNRGQQGYNSMEEKERPVTLVGKT